ncbi:MbnP family copper-binding protein [Motilimonas eburnea]|uniref:MbnP family copper-binding protein n=1 Tax=Motilimonas eburnea TaxID=1737488 RepID=UPI001E53E8EC|nr:MbnP family copper-binding protein [Motilimonas eburnea]MCE2573638.1 metallo-mystery pair system four-Cys motif protein [Motilimonas eburnea]
MKRIGIFIGLLLLLGCSEAPEQRLEVPFSLHFQGELIDANNCQVDSQGLDLNATPKPVVNAVTLYVHNVELQNHQGQWVRARLQGATEQAWHDEQIALLDLTPCQAEPVGGQALPLVLPKGQYQGLRFTLGVPEALNHQDPLQAKPPLDLPAFQWHWTVGYKFAFFDLAWRENSVKYHLGSSGCTGNIGETISCQYKNRPQVSLTHFQPGDKVALELRQFFTELPHARCFGKPQDKGCETLFNLIGLQQHEQRLFHVVD